jgi:hypothetical protein
MRLKQKLNEVVGDAMTPRPRLVWRNGRLIRPLTRRASVAALLVTAACLALPAQTNAATAFWQLLAHNGGEARTLQSRLQEIKNVKDFGAKGDGFTNDASAIQAACDAVSGEGIVFFPRGTYLINSGISLSDLSATPRRISLIGVGDASVITGNFAGFLIDRNSGSDSPERNGIKIEGIKLSQSSSNAAAGCIRINKAMNIGVISCAVQGVRGIVIDENTFSAVVERCIANGFDSDPKPSGGVGILIGCNQARVTECDVVGHMHGVRAHYGGEISNNRIEVNVYGLMLGQDENGGTHPFSGLVSANSFEANYVAIACQSFNNGRIDSFSIQGAETGQGTPAPQPAGGTGQALSGISFGSGQNVTISNASIGSGHTNGGLVFESGGAKPIAVTVENIDCGSVTVGSPFVVPASFKGGIEWRGANKGITDANMQQTYSNLTTFEAEQSGGNDLPIGTIRYISDCNTTTIGATAAGGGANSVAIRKGRTAWFVAGPI